MLVTTSTSITLRAQILTSVRLDPCTNRVRGIWCVNGSIVLMDLIGTTLWGPLSPYIGNITTLRALNIDFTPYINGALPDTMRKLTQLQVLTAAGNNNITNIDIVSSIPSLRYLDFSGNLLSSLPHEIWSLPNLTHVDLHNNAIHQSFPALRNPQQWSYIDIGNNRFVGTLPSFRAGHLSTLKLANNLFSGMVQSDCLDELPQLAVLDLSFNRLQGALPALHGSHALVTIDLTNNSFVAAIPATWLLPQLTTARLSRNSITAPLNLTASTQLAYLDLSYNNITSQGQRRGGDGDGGGMSSSQAMLCQVVAMDGQ